MENLLQYSDLGLYILQFVIAVIFIYHGWPKIAKSKEMASMMGAPAGMVWFHGVVEVLAGLALIFGFLVQWAALVLGLIMIGAIYFKIFRWHTGFSAMDKTGWEFDLALLAGNIAILLTGGGALVL